jgi:serine palmitoyltransferase
MSKTGQPSFYTVIFTFLNYGTGIIFGYFWDYWEKFLSFFIRNETTERFYVPKGYAPLLRSFENFYIRHLYGRIRDCFNRPICSAPGSWIDVQLRKSSIDGRKIEYIRDENGNIKTRKCLNLASYNYLGFAENPKHVTEAVLKSLEKYGVASCSSRNDYGSTDLHRKLEKTVAEFVGKDDAIVVGKSYIRVFMYIKEWDSQPIPLEFLNS